MALSSTQTATRALLAAGLQRDQFRVRTSGCTRRTDDGRLYREYGRTSIFIFLNAEQQLALRPALLANGIDVIIYRDSTGFESAYPEYRISLFDQGRVRYLDVR